MKSANLAVVAFTQTLDFRWKMSSCLFNIILPQKKLRSMILYLYICMAYGIAAWMSLKKDSNTCFSSTFTLSTLFFSHKMNGISIQSFNSSHFKQKCTNAEKKSSVLFVLMYEYIKYTVKTCTIQKKIY